MFGYWPDLSTLDERLKVRLRDFLKCIFTDEIEHRDIHKIMAEKKTYSLLVSGYQINEEDLDIFSCLIFEYLDKDNNDAPMNCVYCHWFYVSWIESWILHALHPILFSLISRMQHDTIHIYGPR